MAHSEEEKFRAEAFESIRRKHHHDDGTEVSLRSVDREGVERKLIEEENLWKLRNRQPENRNVFENSGAPARENPAAEPEDQSSRQPGEKQVVAGCSCGKMFEVSENDDSVNITSFDSSGKAESSYASQGSGGSAGYGSFRDSGEGGYSHSGGAPPSKGGYS